MKNTVLGGVFKVFVLSLAATLAFSSAAFADVVTNLLDNSPAPTQFEEIRVNEGETRGVPLRVIAVDEDGDDDCNIDGSEVLEVGFNSTDDNIAREDPNGSSVVFRDGTDSNSNGCGPNSNGGANPPAAAPDDRSITVRGVSRGAANITVATPPVRNTTGKGTYSYGAATFRVVVQNVAPTANNNAYNVNEDNALTINGPGVLGNDTDPGNNPLTAVLVTNTQNGTLQLKADGSFVYTPNENFSGTDTFTYRTSDGQAESGVATVTINVAPVNDRPDAAPDTMATGEDQPTVVNVLDNDTDAERNPLTVTSNTQPQNGRVTCTPAGVCTYTPNDNFNGVDTFTYTVSDGNGGTATETVTITVGAANDAPNAVNNDYRVPEDGTLNIAGPGVLGNDNDPENDPLTTRLDRAPGNGTINLNPDGSFTYTPGPNFNGSDSFTYHACDGGVPVICSEPATVNIAVEPVNDPPVATGRTIPVDEDGRVEFNVLTNDSDVDGDPLTVTDFTRPQNGAVDCTPQGACTYTPNPDFNGEDSFTYTVSDGNATRTATVRVTVRSVNDAPTARDDAYAAAEDQPLRVDAPGILSNDTDPENNRLRALLETGPSNGTVALLPDGSFLYTPNENFNGRDSFTYRANDDIDSSNAATVVINVAGANDAPRAQNDAATTDEDAPVSVNVRGNDAAGPADETGQTLAVEEIVTQPRNGTARIDADGNVTYTPNPDFNGEDSFVYRVCDDGDPRACATATANVAVNPVNDPPRAAGDTATAREDDPIVVDVTGNDSPGPADERGAQGLTVESVTDPANGRTEIIAEGPNAGLVRYIPDENFNGTDSFEYRVCDNGNPRECATARVEVTVSAVNDPPQANNDAKTVEEDGRLDFPAADLTANDSAGEDGETLTVTEVGSPRNGTVRLVDGRVVFQPDPDYSGPAGFTYTVCDDGDPRACATADVEVTVGPVNDAPVAENDEAVVPEDGSVTIRVLDNDTDADGRDDINPRSVRVVGGPSNGTANVDPLTGGITYTPNPDFGGQDSFTYEVCDDSGACGRATVDVNVGLLNDPPIARDDLGSTGTAALVANSYISQYTSSAASTPTKLFRLDTTRSPYGFGQIGKDILRPMNALGYRSTNRSLYGYRMTSKPGIVRVNASTGAATFLGNPQGLPVASNYYAGDVSPDGNTYYLYGHKSGVLRKVDLRTFKATSVKLSARPNLADVAVSPVNGRLYGVDQYGALLEIAPGTGKVVRKRVPSLRAGTYGATWFTAAGDLIAYENGKSTTKTNGTLNQIKNPTGASPSVASAESGPYTVGNDGAAFVSTPDPAGLAVRVNVLGNDEDADGELDTGTVRVIEPPAHGKAVVNPDGSITYTTDATYGGTDSFRYEICDNDPVRQCATATVNITGASIPLSSSDGTANAPANRSSARRTPKN